MNKLYLNLLVLGIISLYFFKSFALLELRLNNSRDFEKQESQKFQDEKEQSHDQFNEETNQSSVSEIEIDIEQYSNETKPNNYQYDRMRMWREKYIQSRQQQQQYEDQEGRMQFWNREEKENNFDKELYQKKKQYLIEKYGNKQEIMNSYEFKQQRKQNYDNKQKQFKQKQQKTYGFDKLDKIEKLKEKQNNQHN